MLDKDVEKSLNIAFGFAKEYGHEYVTVEHLLLALTDNESAQEVLLACSNNLSLIEFKKKLTDYLILTIPKVTKKLMPLPTLGLQRVIQRGVLSAQSAQIESVNGANLLISILGEENSSQAIFLLNSYGITKLDAMEYVSHGHFAEDSFLVDNSDNKSKRKEQDIDSDENVLVNLNDKVIKKQIDPLIGREDEVLRCLQILSRRKKNNPLLVGEAGVGKTAIAEGIAYKIVHKEVPERMQDLEIYALDLGALLAGTKYRGDFEKKFKKVMQFFLNNKSAVLFIDEIHTIIGAGSVSGGSLDVSNLLKPVLSSGEMQCIGATSFHEYKTIFEKDKALARRFQKLDIKEPSISDAIKILTGLKEYYEEYHDISYTYDAIKAAVNLTDKYINDRFLPDKAIDVIDEAGAMANLLPPSKKRSRIGVAQIEEIVAKIAMIPSKSVSTSDTKLLQNLESNLKRLVFGQDVAIKSLVSSMFLSRSGLNVDPKPIGCFLFAGPTGVGKTEVTKQLAHCLGIKLVRFDMSEYTESHSVSRLIGAPPGYVGFEQGGLLTDAVIKTPHCVLLLDEIEKGHRDIYNLLLQVMDNGCLTDNNGRKADFRHVILVMTTNAGVRETERKAMGFKDQDKSLNALDEINKIFAPEFRNRLDEIIWFKSLTSDVVSKVVDKFILELELQLDVKGVKLHVDKKALKLLAKLGFDPLMGARPMARLISDKIKKPLANELLFGQLTKGGDIFISVANDKDFDIVVKSLNEEKVTV